MLRPCGCGLLLGLTAAVAAVMAAWLMNWWSPRARFRLFIPEELARYRGGPEDPGLYLALLGRVYDVSSGRRHYEPGAHYSGFAGRDASRAFVTGDYSEAGLLDDVSDLSFSDMLTLKNWLSFYEKNYEFIGQQTEAQVQRRKMRKFLQSLELVLALQPGASESGRTEICHMRRTRPATARMEEGDHSQGMWCALEAASRDPARKQRPRPYNCKELNSANNPNE
ncbi:neuferricin isoform X2 [Choloepus didactylus]|uniref:neuferricin isoform X2 n=1 Tax=Choloepus didactylus TaxID=27675 RepID=UPI00189DE345|nr:neuferricin isoform X2 [Choloepus didactylus]